MPFVPYGSSFFYTIYLFKNWIFLINFELSHAVCTLWVIFFLHYLVIFSVRIGFVLR
jgi:hypothetical protein